MRHPPNHIHNHHAIIFHNSFQETLAFFMPTIVETKCYHITRPKKLITLIIPLLALFFVPTIVVIFNDNLTLNLNTTSMIL